MNEHTGSRRAFLAGGAVAAAALAPLAIASVRDDETESLWRPLAPAAREAEIAGWQSSVGARFRIDSEVGTAGAILSAVVELPAARDRPADLARQNPFVLYFEVDSGVAPLGQKTYSVAGTGSAQPLFLARGEDAHGKAVVNAIFN